MNPPTDCARWPIERRWSVRLPNRDVQPITTVELEESPVGVLLGPAGSGKSVEIDLLARAANECNRHVLHRRFVECGTSEDSLRSSLERLAAEATQHTLILLDALDEVLIPIGAAGLVIARWVRDHLTRQKPAICIACRSAVWPPEVEAALREVYGNDNIAVAELRPLILHDIKLAVASSGLNPDGFLAQVEAARARSLAQQPLTLKMMMQVFQVGGRLPVRRDKLFRDGVALLAADGAERRRIGTAARLPTPGIDSAAERLACMTLLSGRHVVDLSDAPSTDALGYRELERLAGDPPLTYDALRDIGRSGLCTAAGLDRFQFAHRQFAEYLAGRRIAELPLHNAKALLSSGGGAHAVVAGPLRETAAFAASVSSDLAEWVAEKEPELVGLSDVANDDLRRRALLATLEKYRTHVLTVLDVNRGAVEYGGFWYPGADQDLRGVLSERQAGCEDVLECAIALVDLWKLASLADALATLTLDATAPFRSRVRAASVLSRVGTPEVCKRLLPLAEGTPGDEEYDLKGAALRCNWPQNLTTSNLLRVLTPTPNHSYHGIYDAFLFDLESVGFDARDDLVSGLTWAKGMVGHQAGLRSESAIVHRMCLAALSRLSDPLILDALADLMLHADAIHAPSPFKRVPRAADEGRDEPALAGLPMERRSLIAAIVAKAPEPDSLTSIAFDTPGLLCANDFPWFLSRATDGSLPVPQRIRFAKFARLCPRNSPIEDLEAWCAVRDEAIIVAHFPVPPPIEIHGPEADQARQLYARQMSLQRGKPRTRLDPPPQQRIAELLRLCETENPRFFTNICRELTLDEFSEEYAFVRFLTQSPGWREADAATQSRIILAAKRYLDEEQDRGEQARSIPLSKILDGPLHAMWLLLDRDPAYLATMPAEWWTKWAWRILRELRFSMIDESDEPKTQLLHLLHQIAPHAIYAELESLAKATGDDERRLLGEILDGLVQMSDPQLEDRLRGLLVEGRVVGESVSVVAQFLLARKPARSLGVCLDVVECASRAESDERLVGVLEALLLQCIGKSWGKVRGFLSSRPDLAREVLTRFAAGNRRHRPSEDNAFINEMTVAEVGQLASLLMRVFPVEEDERHTSAHFVGHREMAERLRDQLVNWLADRSDCAAVESLRALEVEFGTKHKWLGRLRARAERRYRLSIWEPISPTRVAEILEALDKRLVRSPADVADGIVAALDEFERSLRRGSAPLLDDLWNLPKEADATPRDEARIAEKVCQAVRSYFEQYAVTANREVEIRHRRKPHVQDSAQGSRLDVLVSLPACGTSHGEQIEVPIELKLAHNREALSGLREQLFDRYMKELGSDVGVYVVVWMGHFDPRFRLPWETADAARRALEEAATQCRAEDVGDVRVVVIDASRPASTSAQKRSRGPGSRKRSPRRSRPHKPRNNG